nr:hypothetical protein [Paracoccus sp. M683]
MTATGRPSVETSRAADDNLAVVIAIIIAIVVAVIVAVVITIIVAVVVAVVIAVIITIISAVIIVIMTVIPAIVVVVTVIVVKTIIPIVGRLAPLHTFAFLFHDLAGGQIIGDLKLLVAAPALHFELAIVALDLDIREALIRQRANRAIRKGLGIGSGHADRKGQGGEADFVTHFCLLFCGRTIPAWPKARVDG